MIDERSMTLAMDMTGQEPVKGWLASEKIFDCRAYWHAGEFWTRSGHQIKAPAAVRFGGRWFADPGLEFVAFDFPELHATWDKRIREAARAVKGSAAARAVTFERIRDIHQFVAFLTRIRKLGGEGGIFRNPDAVGYETGRSVNYLRVKF